MSTRTVFFASLSAAFAIANVAVAVPARAAEAAPSTTVRFADLDLTTQSDVARLDRRLRSAATIVCGTADMRDLSRTRIVDQCRKVALDGAAPQVASVIEQARNGTRFANATPLRVAAR